MQSGGSLYPRYCSLCGVRFGETEARCSECSAAWLALVVNPFYTLALILHDIQDRYRDKAINDVTYLRLVRLYEARLEGLRHPAAAAAPAPVPAQGPEHAPIPIPAPHPVAAIPPRPAPAPAAIAPSTAVPRARSGRPSRLARRGRVRLASSSTGRRSARPTFSSTSAPSSCPSPRSSS